MRLMSQISIDNYLGTVKPNLTAREKQALEILEELGQGSTDDIADYLKVTPNRVSGRMTGLKNKKLIVFVRTDFNKLGNSVGIWKPRDMQDEYPETQ